jgi:hypothetical protein
VASALSLLLVGWILFFHRYVFDPASPGFKFPWTPLSDYAKFSTLMLTAPAGWDGAGVLHYSAGLVILGMLLATMYHASRSFFKNPTLSSPESVILLLCLSSLLYCAHTAVGRVQTGVAAGLTSRYITLVTPAWLGLYLWIAWKPTIRRFGTYAALWALVAWPYFSLHGRPVAEWMGSLGSSRWIYERVQKISDQKLTFVMRYLQEGDARLVASTAHALIFPEDNINYLDEKLAFQRLHRLSFFAHPDEPFGYAPWLVHDYLKWILAFDSERRSRWIGTEADLELGTRSNIYLNFRILDKNRMLSADALLTVRIGDSHAEMDIKQGLTGVSIPVIPGSCLVRFESQEGAFVPGSGDPRKLSFLISEPELTPLPSYVPWILDGVQRTYRRAYEFNIDSGFYGWEGEGSFGWMSNELNLSVRASTPVFLNVAISERLPNLPNGPVVVSCEGFRRALDLGSRGLSFSLMLPARSQPYHISVLNSTGADEPNSYGTSLDTRKLALKLTRLSVNRNADFRAFYFSN